jgi:hypothetical protein
MDSELNPTLSKFAMKERWIFWEMRRSVGMKRRIIFGVKAHFYVIVAENRRNGLHIRWFDSNDYSAKIKIIDVKGIAFFIELIDELPWGVNLILGWESHGYNESFIASVRECDIKRNLQMGGNWSGTSPYFWHN